jgi:hypothetical protein
VKNASGMLRHVAVVRTDILKERIDSIVSVKRNRELGKLAVTSNRSTLRRNTISSQRASVTSLMLMLFLTSRILSP